jgi:N-acetylglucosaminyldiphosphoundecaprenol N-acetyl-beta-D-mannosaminyltransferase
VLDKGHSYSRRTNVLGVGVSSLNMNEAVQDLLDARVRGEKGYVCVTGVHGVIESQRNPELRLIHNQSFLTVPDGMPTVWMGREQGFTKMGRVYGPDLMLRLMEATSSGGDCDGESATLQIDNSTFAYPSQDETGGLDLGDVGSTFKCKPSTDQHRLTHFLFGATEEMLSKLESNLRNRFPGVKIVGSYAPPFRPLNDEEEAALCSMVAECKPDFFWVGLSTPKQETFMAVHADNPDFGIMLGVGAAFPIHAGLQKDAPEWIKNSGLQWFYRLCQDPKRLWRRYLHIVPVFLWLAALQLLGVKRYIIEDDGL